MKKEDFIRKHDDACCYYFDGYYSSCIEDFLGEIYDDFEAEIKAKEERIKELKEAMKPKTCEGCKWEQETKLITTKVGDKVDICKLCTRYENLQDHYEKKVTP